MMEVPPRLLLLLETEVSSLVLGMRRGPAGALGMGPAGAGSSLHPALLAPFMDLKRRLAETAADKDKEKGKEAFANEDPKPEK